MERGNVIGGSEAFAVGGIKEKALLSGADEKKRWIKSSSFKRGKVFSDRFSQGERGNPGLFQES